MEPGRFAAEIAVDHSGGENGARLRAPYDAVEFLPRVAEIEAVEVDDHQPSIFQHQVADVIIPVLEALRAAGQKERCSCK